MGLVRVLFFHQPLERQARVYDNQAIHDIVLDSRASRMKSTPLPDEDPEPPTGHRNPLGGLVELPPLDFSDPD